MPEYERGQTEVLGFFLIFSLVILAIALVGVTGFTGLDNAQEFQETTSTEQAFVVLSDNIDDVARQGAPNRETEIRLSEASLSLGETEQINITVAGNTTTIESQPIVYESREDTTISYSSGLVVREDGDNGVLVRQPKFELNENVVVLPIIATTAVDETTVAGTAATQVDTRSSETAIVAAQEYDGNTTVTIEISSPRVDFWAEYLDGKMDNDCTPTDGTVQCSIETGGVFVSVEDIQVGLR